MFRTKVVDKMKHTSYAQHTFLRESYGFRYNKRNFYIVSSHNSKTVGLILIRFTLEILARPTRLFYDIHKRASKVSIDEFKILEAITERTREYCYAMRIFFSVALLS
jgi:hypothetical protein